MIDIIYRLATSYFTYLPFDISRLAFLSEVKVRNVITD